MIDFINVRLEEIAIHKVGNKLRDEGIKLATKNAELDDSETISYLLKYFLSPFNENEVYNFHHPSDLNLNEIYFFIKKIFASPEDLHTLSIDIARHLYEKSTHPKVNEGELCICLFRKCRFNGTNCDAIGIFKSEGKDIFLNFDSIKTNFKIRYESGININKLDKGCLVFNIERSKGYQVCIIDSNKSNDTQYWKNDFLNLKPASDNYHFTKDILSVAKNFVTRQLPDEFEITKTDQIDLLNRSVEYFKTHERFVKKEFEKDVLQDVNIIKSFRNFDSSYRQENEIEVPDDFSISSQALKKQERVFKSVLKLDKNFHIYIHGNREMIEQGVEKDGRKYYKIYYEEEQ